MINSTVKVDRPNGYWVPEQEVTSEEVAAATAILPRDTNQYTKFLQLREGGGTAISWIYHRAPRFHDFKVEAPEAHSKRNSVWMDGIKLRGVVAVSTEAKNDDLNRITITFIAGSINSEPQE